MVLEISRQGKALKMCIFEKGELSSTLRHYSQQPVSFTEISRLCSETMSILNKTGKTGVLDSVSCAGFKKTCQLLWDYLFTKPVKERLKESYHSDLVLSIDEELVDIPWELIYDGKDFLCLKFNLGRLVKTAEQIHAPQYRSRSSKVRMLILANPTNDLKSAYLEGVYIRNQFDSKRKEISIDFKSTSIDTFYVKKNLRDYDIVHFAGHCEYGRGEPKDTGWLLKDGKFTVRDILALAQTQSFPGLVFSNACHSANTAKDLLEEGCQGKAYGLAWAFLFSGVRHYIGTIWKVEDPVSLVFAKEFYARLLKGDSVGEGLRLARLKLIKEYGIEAICWAGYVLYGNPDFFLFSSRHKLKAPGIKRDFTAYKKAAIKLSLVMIIAVLTGYIYLRLPSLSPNSYMAFFESRRLFAKGKNQEASVFLNRINKKDPGFLAAYPLLARAYLRLGQRDNALRTYFDYALYSEQRHSNKDLSSAYIGIGEVYQAQGDYGKSFDFYNKAIALSRKNSDHLGEAVALRRMAVWRMDRQEYDKAMELLMKSSEINRERQHIYAHRYNLACDYFDIGLVFTDKDDFSSAKEFYNKSRILFSRLKLTYELSDYYFNMGEICLFEKEYQKALDYYLKGIEIDRLHDNRTNLASDYNMLGELYIEINDFTQAEKYFADSVHISEQINARPELAGAYRNLALLYQKRGQINKARDYFRQAQEIYRLMDTPDYQEIKKDLLALTANE